MSRSALLNEVNNPSTTGERQASSAVGTDVHNGGGFPATAPVVRLDQVSRHFGRFAAIRGISAEFTSGRLYTVVGDNGAGKSTLLRMIAGLIAPTRGRIEVLGTTDLRSVRAHIGYMAHAPLLYEELNAMENLRYFAGLYGIHDDSVCKRAIATVGLDPALNRRVGQYSQGMRQRLSLARAILHDPRLLLLDEPFSNVDITSARDMVQLLARMRGSGKAIFLVTHQPSLLEGAADEFVHMSLGRIIVRTTSAAQPDAVENNEGVSR